MTTDTQCTHTQPCVCVLSKPQQITGQLTILLHPNEPERPSNTAKLITQIIPATSWHIWQRKDPPQQLLSMLKQPGLRPWLIFPADRPELSVRAKQWTTPPSGTVDLFIILDGTWKEVRKIIRQSPWLSELPLLSFTPSQRTRYTLRRNPDAEHLCTAEIASEVLKLTVQTEAATALDEHLKRFLEQYHCWQNHLPLPY